MEIYTPLSHQQQHSDQRFAVAVEQPSSDKSNEPSNGASGLEQQAVARGVADAYNRGQISPEKQQQVGLFCGCIGLWEHSLCLAGQNAHKGKMSTLKLVCINTMWTALMITLHVKIPISD